MNQILAVSGKKGGDRNEIPKVTIKQTREKKKRKEEKQL